MKSTEAGARESAIRGCGWRAHEETGDDPETARPPLPRRRDRVRGPKWFFGPPFEKVFLGTSHGSFTALWHKSSSNNPTLYSTQSSTKSAIFGSPTNSYLFVEIEAERRANATTRVEK